MRKKDCDSWIKKACQAFCEALKEEFEGPTSEQTLSLYVDHDLAEEEFAARNNIASDAAASRNAIQLLWAASATQLVESRAEKLHYQAVTQLGLFKELFNKRQNTIAEETVLRDELKTLESDDGAIVGIKTFSVV